MVPLLLTRLRAATHELHLELERTPCMARLQADDLDPQDVIRVLRVLAVGFARLEPPLVALDWYRPQGPAITQDLHRLTAGPMPPPSPGQPPGTPPDGALGTAYVLTGSRLGTRAISRRLAARLGPAFVENSAYYGAESAFAGPQWAALTAALGSGARDHERELAAAVGAFGLLRDLAQQADPAVTA